MDDPTARSATAVIAVAASAGGVEALQHFVAGLPEGLPAAVLVVLHIPPSAPSVLPGILARAGKLPARHPDDRDELEDGVILVAPPDRHLAVEDGRVRILPGPKENGRRPSADILLRSAAEQYGRRAAGVVLSGTMDDGAAGLRAIRTSGGFSVVQEPSEAAFPGMPKAAIEAADPQVVCPVREIGSTLAKWVGKLDTERGGEEGELPPDDPAEAPQGMVSAFTCPDCGGSLWKVDDYGVERYRCRVGHLFSDDGLLLGKQEALEAAVWAAMVALEEKADVCRRIAKRLTAGGHAERSEKYWNEAAAAEEHLRWLKGTLEQMIVTFPEVYEERDA